MPCGPITPGPAEMFLRMPATWQVERGESTRRATSRFVAGEAQAGSGECGNGALHLPFLSFAEHLPNSSRPLLARHRRYAFTTAPATSASASLFRLFESSLPPCRTEFQQCLQTPARFVLSTLLPFLDRCCCVGAHPSTPEPVHIYCGPGVLVNSRSRALYFVQELRGTRRQDLFVVGVLEEIWKGYGRVGRIIRAVCRTLKIVKYIVYFVSISFLVSFLVWFLFRQILLH